MADPPEGPTIWDVDINSGLCIFISVKERWGLRYKFVKRRYRMELFEVSIAADIYKIRSFFLSFFFFQNKISLILNWTI